MGWLKFNNITTNELDTTQGVTVIEGVVIQTPPIYEFPLRRVNVVQINGRNGDVVIDKNTFDNSVREYNIAAVLGTSEDAFVLKARELVDWLSLSSGYARLEDSYEPLYFRLAMFRSGGQIPNFYNKATAINLKFECKPQRFLKSGETPVTITDGVWFNVINDTKYIALPEITITGTDVNVQLKSGTIVEPVGDIVSSITIYGETVSAKIDSELQDCYDDSEFLNNRVIATNGFPKLYPGNNWIFVSLGAVVTIKPRLWVL